MQQETKTFVPAVLVICMAASAARAAEPGYASQPTIHENTIIFVSEGDLWTAALPEQPNDAPIIAWRLTSSDGEEAHPAISPDGTRVAFSAEYDGNVDAYIMPVTGGVPTRLTYHGGEDEVLSWLPDNRHVVFRSSRANALGRDELWRVSTAGGMPQRYDFGECSLVSFSTTGRRIAFTRWSNENWHWKRYRGGTAPEIWIGDLNASTFSNITDNAASDLYPMWLLGRVFFVSDRDGTANLYSMSTDGSNLQQRTHFAWDANDPAAVDGYDVRWASSESRPRGTKIVFCQGGRLVVFDAVDGSVRRLDVQLASDRVVRRQRFVPVMETLTEFALSPDGQRLVVGSRGELIAVPVEGGPHLQLTHTSGAREWGATFLQSDRIALISDASGEQQIAVMPVDGSDQPGVVTENLAEWLMPPQCSPDGRWIAFADKNLRLNLIDMHTFEQTVIDQSDVEEITDYRFSPDSMWLAYVMPAGADYNTVHLRALRTGRSFQVSSGLTDDRAPRWDPAGAYLYFLSARHFDPIVGAFDFDYVQLDTTRIVAVPLSADAPPPDAELARAAGFDLQQWATRNAGPGKAAENGADGAQGGEPLPEAFDEAADAPPAVAAVDEPDSAPLRVDTAGMAERAFILPVAAGSYSDLEAVWGGVTYLSQPRRGLLEDNWPDDSGGNGTLIHYDIVSKQPNTLATGTDRYAISGDRSTLAVPTDTGFTVLHVGADGPDTLDLADAQLRINVPQEWTQIFDESWRLQRDFYWAPNLHGVDWSAIRQKYSPLLARVGTRAELNDVIGEMIGELGTSHTYIWGGARYDEARPVSVGALGIDVVFEGGFRIERILPEPPIDDRVRSPLADPHLGVEPGDYIVAINGVALHPGDNIHELLQDTAGRTIVLTVADDATGTNRRGVQVETLDDDRMLRYLDWVHRNYTYVQERSDGAIGYVHIPDMGGEGLSLFSRYFFPQSRRKAIIIDLRDNGGGFVSQMIIEKLARRPIGYMQPRQGRTERYPLRAVDAHMAALIDEHAGSDGDIFPTVFRALDLGPLIGTRTWGGVIGIRGDRPFVDRGLSTQPEFAWWQPQLGWSIENHGVDPDIEVEITPADRVQNADPQLDRAIEYLLQKLETDPKTAPTRPPYPSR